MLWYKSFQRSVSATEIIEAIWSYMHIMHNITRLTWFPIIRLNTRDQKFERFQNLHPTSKDMHDMFLNIV